MTRILDPQENSSKCILNFRLFQILFDAIYVPTSPIPKTLTGGFTAWKYLVTSQNELNNNEWIEIGEANGVLPIGGSSARGNGISYNPLTPVPRSNNTSTTSINSYQSSNNTGYISNKNNYSTGLPSNQTQNNYSIETSTNTVSNNNYGANYQTSNRNSSSLNPQNLTGFQHLQQKYQALSVSGNPASNEKAADNTYATTYSTSFANKSPPSSPANYARSPADYVVTNLYRLPKDRRG